MRETLLILLVAHLVADFLLQTGWIVSRKRQPAILILHVAVVGSAALLLLGSAPLPLLGFLILSHGILDAVKTHLLPERLWTFLADQLAHIGVILGLAVAFPDAAQHGFWLTSLGPEESRIYMMTLTVLGGVLVAVPVGGLLIGIVTAPLLKEIRLATEKRQQIAVGYSASDREELLDELDDGIEGLQRGGRYIGWLERALIMLLLFMNQASSIGFLFAAKSILRYGDIKNARQRKVAEYIIIGTLLSFGWGLLTTFVTQQVLTLW